MGILVIWNLKFLGDPVQPGVDCRMRGQAGSIW